MGGRKLVGGCEGGRAAWAVGARGCVGTHWQPFKLFKREGQESGGDGEGGGGGHGGGSTVKALWGGEGVGGRKLVGAVWVASVCPYHELNPKP